MIYINILLSVAVIITIIYAVYRCIVYSIEYDNLKRWQSELLGIHSISIGGIIAALLLYFIWR